jgi:hypothetical protein
MLITYTRYLRSSLFKVAHNAGALSRYYGFKPELEGRPAGRT